MSREDILRNLLGAFETSKRETERDLSSENSLSEADITATRYMQRVLEAQKRCAQELQGLGFEG
jgi:hypothetical protein